MKQDLQQETQRIKKEQGTYNLSDFGLNADANAAKLSFKDAERLSRKVPTSENLSQPFNAIYHMKCLATWAWW